MLARQHARVQALLQHRQCALEPAPVDEIEQMQAAVVGEREHRAERRLEPLGVQHARRPRPRRRGADEAREGFAKSAAGFEALVQLRVEHGLSLSDVEEREAHAPRAVIGLEGHAAIALELAPRGRRVDAHLR